MPAIDLFAFLDGASAWWWVALALALGAAEVVTFTYFLLWLALGTMTVAAMLFVSPEASGTSQIVVFALSTLFYAVAGWAWLRARRRGDTVEGPGLNRRAAQLVGRSAIVCSPFRAGVGKVELDGVAWRARLDPTGGRPGPEPTVGAVLTVTATEGATLVVAETAPRSA